MRRFLRTVLISCVISALLCVGAVLIGRSQPLPEFLPELGICSGIPCYMGIVLNKTTWEEAERIFSKTAGFTLNSEFTGADIANGPVARIITYSDGEKIYQIVLGIREGTFAAYRLLTDLGVPCAVFPYWAGPTRHIIVLFYQDRTVEVLLDEKGITPRSPIVRIDLI